MILNKEVSEYLETVEKLYGKSFDKMDESDKWMAMFILLGSIVKRTDCVARHERLFWIASFASPLLLAFVVWIAITMLSHLGVR